MSTDRTLQKKRVAFVKRMVNIKTNIVPSKDPVVRRIETNILLSQVNTLDSKDRSHMWCRGYGKNYTKYRDFVVAYNR